LISNIMIIVFLVKAKHWYQAIRVLKINEDLENLKTEMPNHSV